MQTVTKTAPIPKTSLLAGRIIGALVALFMLWDGIIKVMVIAPVVDSHNHLGIPVELAAGIGLVELACLAIALIPRTRLLGALLLTGFLGGATAIHVRIGDPFYFPILMGVLLWSSLLLTDIRVRRLVSAD